MRQPVSVVLTCYNLERYVEDAVRSVWDQDYEGDVDLLVVDDCSTDGSGEVLARLQAQGSMRCVRLPSNQGVLLATVTGLEQARGNIVCFLDADDVWEPGKLRAIVSAFESNDAVALVTHDLTYIDERGWTLERRSRVEEVMDANDPHLQGLQVQQGILNHSDHVWLGSAFAIRMDSSQALGFCAYARGLPDARNTYQDWPLAYWAASRPGTRCAYVAQKLFRYRLHGKNHSGDSTDVSKAIRNVRRTLNTMVAIEGMEVQQPLCSHARAATLRKLGYFEMLDALYGGRHLKAWGGLFRSVPYLVKDLSGANAMKELLRFVLVQIFGLTGFIRLRAWRS